MSTTIAPRLPALFGVRRIALYVAASLLLHALLLRAFDHGLRFGAAEPVYAPAPVEATIVEAAVAVPRVRVAPARRAPRAIRKAPSIDPIPPAPAADTAPSAQAPESTATPSANASPGDAVSGEATTAGEASQTAPTPSTAIASGEAAAPTSTTDAAAETTTNAVPDTTADQRLHIDHWPPNGTLTFKALALQGKTPYYGTGELHWQIADGRYRIEQTMGLDLLITTLRLQSSTSEGSVQSDGLAPDRYTEQRRSRATVATNFNREPDKQTITFSASSKAFPLAAGAQDRASVLFQLAGLVRSATDPARIDAYEVQLAGTRGVETWSFALVGEEELALGPGPARALHFVRLPRPESYESRVEIWYAAAFEGYPVRIRYTERNGDVIDLTLDAFRVGAGS
ncbi:MAG: DUF3108 domain-containing protein [Aquabacterium sp.]|uniref:DUF3108 domain-containing protein n=1 Tax=Aquabacterium sp. TaxID=1872578 RepID=UPI00122B2296|nr:DUF3108 domain-containing protein [Aquabacterium sp.]TAK82655.1 MAG: DUF3108 domain-containing protein [Aquabacterium sp.]